MRELRQLRAENGKLSGWSRSLAGPAHVARDRPKKAVKPRHGRELWRWTQAAFAVSERTVARLAYFSKRRGAGSPGAPSTRLFETWRRLDAIPQPCVRLLLVRRFEPGVDQALIL
jgi:hypothetical protein